MYSSYKSHTTKKGLVAISPNGTFIFVTELFSGSITGFLDMLQLVPLGKSIMADRGFDIQDLLAEEKVLLNIPAFHSSAALSEQEVLSTQKIARGRIHAERAIG